MDAHTLYTSDTDLFLMKKALTDYKEQLIPILNKLRNGQRLTPEEEEDVEWITMRERMKLNEDMRPYEYPAYDEGKAYVDNVLDSGGDLDDLKVERESWRDERLSDQVDRPEQHPVEIDYRKPELTPEEKLRDAVRDRTANMGTNQRAYAADAAKIRGIGYAIDDHERDGSDEFRYR